MSNKTWTPRDGTRLHILLLEDDEDLALMLTGFLESHACKVTRCANGVEGLRRIMVDDFDLVICDMVMSSFPGDKFYIAVERVKPALCRRFLFMTGHRADPKYEAFIQEIGGLIIWKPFETQELLAAMLTVLRKAEEIDVAEWSKALAGSRSP